MRTQGFSAAQGEKLPGSSLVPGVLLPRAPAAVQGASRLVRCCLLSESCADYLSRGQRATLGPWNLVNTKYEKLLNLELVRRNMKLLSLQFFSFLLN